MAIETAFSFAHEVHQPESLAAAAKPDLLGLLRGLPGGRPGAKAQRKWRGKGFNMLFRPNLIGAANNPKDFFLQLNFTDETLEFTEVTGTGIANRGLLQPDIILGAVAYTQAINDSFDNSGQHFEAGVWANIPATTNPLEQATVTRMASIPHGTTVNLQGRGLTAPLPRFSVASTVPFKIGDPTHLVDFPDRILANASQSRTSLDRVKGLTQDHLDNPNLFLSDAIAKQTILSTTVLIINSDTSAASSIPDAGGGLANIAFLTGKGAPPTGGPNALAASTTAIFWIERIKGEHGQPDYDQLQYTQEVLLNFGGLSWPHITVATLRADDGDNDRDDRGHDDDHGDDHGHGRG